MLTTLSIVLAKKEQENFGIRCFDKADSLHDIPRVTHTPYQSIIKPIISTTCTCTHTHIRTMYVYPYTNQHTLTCDNRHRNIELSWYDNTVDLRRRYCWWWLSTNRKIFPLCPCFFFFFCFPSWLYSNFYMRFIFGLLLDQLNFLSLVKCSSWYEFQRVFKK